MAAEEGQEEYVYRISSAEEWEQLQKEGFVYGGDLDKSTGCFHLSRLSQVQSTLQNFFLGFQGDLYLLQVDAKKVNVSFSMIRTIYPMICSVESRAEIDVGARPTWFAGIFNSIQIGNILTVRSCFCRCYSIRFDQIQPNGDD